MLRRSLLTVIATAVPVGFLTSCVGTSGAVTLEQAKAYMADASGAVLAAAQAFLVSQPPPNVSTAAMVHSLMAKLEATQAALSSVGSVGNWQDGAIEAVTVLQQLLPLVSVYLGSAGPVLPIALAVIEAFIHSWPAPVDAPVVPPAALHAKALQYHRHH